MREGGRDRNEEEGEEEKLGGGRKIRRGKKN